VRIETEADQEMEYTLFTNPELCRDWNKQELITEA
jgi:hypothetical protein